LGGGGSRLIDPGTWTCSGSDLESVSPVDPVLSVDSVPLTDSDSSMPSIVLGEPRTSSVPWTVGFDPS
jgi:hypothetical protein